MVGSLTFVHRGCPELDATSPVKGTVAQSAEKSRDPEPEKSSVPWLCSSESITCRAVLPLRPNHLGKPSRRLNPPGGNLSSSLALTVSLASFALVENVYVVKGTRSG
jgi:hypothetical protein